MGSIRVLDVGEMVSAPYAARLLADLGAEVIKVEPPGGERSRFRGPFRDEVDPEASGLFLGLNTGKRSVVADLTTDDGRAILDELVAEADIVFDNHRVGEHESLGLTYERLAAINPALVVCSITPFGLTGPDAHYRAEEITTNHGGGWGWLSPGASQEIEKPPLKAFGHQADFQAGVTAATAALGVLRSALTTGHGELIDLSVQAQVASAIEAAFLGWSYTRQNPTRLGDRLLQPWGIFPCADGLIFLVCVEQDQWERLIEMMGTPEWTALGIFDDQPSRHANSDLLTLYIAEWTSQHTVQELFVDGQARRIAFAPVYTMADLAKQEHLAERDFFRSFDHPKAGTVSHVGPPFSVRPRPSAPSAAPLLGANDGTRFGSRPPRKPPSGAGANGTAPDVSSTRPLTGITVADFSWVWAGPFCTLHLAYLGADVIKLESEVRPNLARRLPTHAHDIPETLNTNGYFNQWDQAKRSATLNLGTPEGRETAFEMAVTSDVVVDNYATGVMDRMGLGYEALKARRPDIIAATISGYGSTGRYSDYMGYGPTTSPLSGISSLTGYRYGPPREVGIALGDPASGIATACAITAALVNRDLTGEGAFIDVALWEATAAGAIEGWMAHQLTGGAPERMGNRDPLMAPHGCFRCAEPTGELAELKGESGNWITIACATDDDWQRLAALIDPDLPGDDRFTTASKRKADEDALEQIVGAWTADHDQWELTRRIQEAGVAGYPSLSPAELEQDRQLVDRGVFERLDHAAVGRRTHVGIPWRLTERPNGVPGPAPLLGHDTETVLAERLGLDNDRIAALRSADALR